MQTADDVIEVAAVNRIAGVRLRANDRPELVRLRAYGYADEQDARHHRFPGGTIAELEEVAQQLA